MLNIDRSSSLPWIGRLFMIAGCVLPTFLTSLQASAQVRIEDSPDRVSVFIDGKPFTALQAGWAAHKSYLSPIFTASGKRITRGYPDEPLPGEPTDHPHQRGIWMGSEHLSGTNLWEIDPADPHPHMGSIHFDRVLDIRNGEDSGTLKASATWRNQDDKPVIDETLVLTFYAHTGARRIMDIEMHLKSLQAATFEDARDGVIGIRFAPAFDEKLGAKIINAEGVEGAKPIEGLHSAWVDWQAKLDGEPVGVTLMDSPQNYRTPTTWITRSMGLLFANPFAQRYYDRSREDGSLSLQPGDELVLRYRLLIHPAGTNIAAAYKEYAKQ